MTDASYEELYNRFTEYTIKDDKLKELEKL